MNIFTKGTTMLANLKRLIYGVPADSGTEAGRMASQRQQDAEQPTYLPASKLSQAAIEGAVCDDGSCWTSWRTDADGELWFERISADAAEQPAEIRGISANDDDGADDIEAFDSDEPDHECDSTDEIVSRFRRETSLIKARHARGEMPDEFDGDDGEFGDADDDFGDADDDD